MFHGFSRAELVASVVVLGVQEAFTMFCLHMKSSSHRICGGMGVSTLYIYIYIHIIWFVQ